MKKAILTEEEILEIVKSAVKQASHPYPSPETLEKLRETTEKMEEIEKMIRTHSEDENGILRGIQESVSHIITDQAIKHGEIESQLRDIKPIRDGLTAANTIKKGILWMSGFVAGLSLIVISIKQLSK